MISSFIRLIQGPAGRGAAVHQELKVAAEFSNVDLSCLPLSFLGRILRYIRRGKHLVEVSACDHIIALLCLTLQQMLQLSCLSGFSLTAVICFQMKVHKNQFFPVLGRDPGDQETPFQVRHTDRPGERTGKRFPDSLALMPGGQDRDPAVHGTDRRDRIRNEGHLKVIGKVRFHIRKPVREHLHLIHMMGTHGIHIGFLQEDDIRILPADRLQDRRHILVHSVFGCGIDPFSSVHEEIRIISESTVSDVPRKNTDRSGRRKGTVDPAPDGKHFSLTCLRVIFRHGKIAYERRRGKHHDQKDNADDPQYTDEQ